MIAMRRDIFSVKSHFQNLYYLLPFNFNVAMNDAHVLLTCIVESSMSHKTRSCVTGLTYHAY